MSYPTFLTRVERQIRDEREAQDRKWGEQNHPDGTNPLWSTDADDARSKCQRKAADGTLTWRDVLLEEVFEALAETDPAKLRAELIQTAAVCVAWAEAIDRRKQDAEQAGGDR